MKGKKPRLRYIRFFLDQWRDPVRQFDDGTLGKLFSAAVRYADAGEEADFPRDSEAWSAWLFLRGQLYRDLYYHGRRDDA